jgi:hypothetical protein
VGKLVERNHDAVLPPFTAMTWPVMNEALAEATKTMASAISSGLPASPGIGRCRQKTPPRLCPSANVFPAGIRGADRDWFERRVAFLSRTFLHAANDV